MKHFFPKGLLLCLSFLLFGINSNLKAQTQIPSSEIQKVKVITYNIWNGFGSGHIKDRVDLFVEWVKKENPDVLALEELCGYDHDKLKKLAARYGHPYVAILVGDSHPVALTSKTPLKEIFKQIEGYGHGMLHCKTLGLDFLVTHLTPGDAPERRLKRKAEADNIVKYIHENKLDSCVFMGDLNSVSPFDAHIGNRDLGQYTVISTFMGAPLHDICYLFNSDKDRTTFPTQLKRIPQEPDILRYAQLRLDYIFVTDALFPSCVEGIFYRGPEIEFLSDHSPIRITMYLNR